MSKLPIILGSSSIARREVLRRAGYEFTTLSPDIDEKGIRSDDIYKLPLLIAREKMKVLLSKVTEPAILIAADQVVVCNGQLYEKPSTAEDARAMLNSYSDYPAETVSAVVVTNTETGAQSEAVDVARAHFTAIPPEAIDSYVATEVPFINAGAFDHEDPILAQYLKSLDGTPDSVMGLPLAVLERLIAEVS